MDIIELDNRYRSTIEIIDNDSLEKPDQFADKSSWREYWYIILKIIDILLDAFIITPLIIFYWAATWDMYYYYTFPENYFYRCLLAFIISNIILLVTYIFQNEIQRIHNKFESIKCIGFILRSFYTYILTVAYIGQWVAFWDFYQNLTEDIELFYFVIVSVISLLIIRFVLGKSWMTLSLTVPFNLTKDSDYDSYFIQSNYISHQNV